MILYYLFFSSFLQNNLDVQYFVVVLLLLLIEFSICVIITFWPQCLGLNLDEPLMVKALQANYGVPGKEQVIFVPLIIFIQFRLNNFKILFQMTASIDLAQTKFKCCAINSNLNYDMSYWRLQNFGQRDYAVPKTCCILTNSHEPSSFLDPKPQNLTMCQSLLKDDYSKARHTESCLEHLDVWYRQHYVVFLSASFVLALVEFGVLLSIILSCMQMLTQTKQHGVICRTTGTTMRTNVFAKESPVMSSLPSPKRRPAPQPQQQQQHQSQLQGPSHFHKITPINENVYVTSGLSELSNARYRDRYTDSMKPPNAYSYHMSKSYLV